MQKIIIAGLGNPGKKYIKTPHNAGFSAVDKLVNTLRQTGYAVGESHSKDSATYDVPMGETRLVIVKPLLYMNKSGEVLKNMIGNNLSPSNLWVVHDDIDIALGSLRIKKGGTAAGHNGVEDIIKNIKTKDFYRFRIGVKPENMPEKRSSKMMSDFVTKKLPKDAEEVLDKMTATTAELALKAVEIRDIESLAGNYSIE
ncbi:MAG: aminoacyl-tRNA hydrolase [Candidatus Spechtbacterales bacterium]|nr:aminoacyl-tRNA hydrolase [Candidatus Spechtbacterales bacterium]